MTEPRTRRSGDTCQHAHKRLDDEFARLHQRMDDSDKLINELMKVRFELLQSQRDLADNVSAMSNANASADRNNFNFGRMHR